MTKDPEQRRIEGLFLNALLELEERLRSGDEYKLLGMTLYLRQLLNDGSPLVHQVNRRYRQEVTFQVSPPEPGAATALFASQISLEPVPFLRPLLVNLQRLLGVPVAHFQGEAITVLDVIEHEAYNAGGIHVQKPKPEPRVAAVNAFIKFGPQAVGMTRAALVGIARVTLTALEPLRQAVQQS